MSQSLSLIEKSKQKAAYQAIEDHVLPLLNETSAQLFHIGIGSGSTIVYAIERLAQLNKEELKKFVFFPTSFQALELIRSNNWNLGSLDSVIELDVAIDGADEVDAQLNAIKGGGACQLQEKVIAALAKKFVLIADYRKESEKLGTNWTQGIPIEVVPFAYRPLLHQLTQLGSEPKLRMAKSGKAGPVVTDNGNLVIDAIFPPLEPGQVEQLNLKLCALPGVVEVGLFPNMAQIAYFGLEDGNVVKKLKNGERILV